MKIQIENVENYGNKSLVRKISNSSKLFIAITNILILALLMASCYYIYMTINNTETQTLNYNDDVIVTEAKENNNNDNNFINSEVPIIVELPAEEINKPYIPSMTNKGIENIEHIYKSDYKRVFLTFDDGPSADVTELILDLLKQENIKATFFVLGDRAKTYPDIVKREYEEGHYIGNHGYSHVYSKIYESIEATLDEYDRTEEAIAEAIGIEGYHTNLFRFPGGSVGGYYDSIKSEIKKSLVERNIAYLDWNALTRDAEGKFTKEQLLQNLKDTVNEKNSVVVLCHDAAGKILTYEVLPDIIAYFREAGYTFADMRELVE